MATGRSAKRHGFERRRDAQKNKRAGFLEDCLVQYEIRDQPLEPRSLALQIVGYAALRVIRRV
ncbi:hypothetical protein CLG96_00060 [Sphingomonas oleivorans]|uniref:Uncharacterized protein n=1 Tax=Sphingomonas oleivorans TaxID=1735121 RepID=A0A2T5G3A7_9SPHN|nr:hypothetical protein CLG96_00060 [Sphingomonas oleivorans]